MTEIPIGSFEGTKASTVGNHTKADSDLVFLLKKTTFDPGAAVIMYPELADKNSPEARSVLAWYADFYKNLSESPQTTVVMRHSIATPDGCRGLGQREPDHRFGVLSVRFFNNLPADAIKFVQYNDGRSAAVNIDHPSVGVTNNGLLFENRPVRLFSSNLTNTAGLGLSTEPEILTRFGDDPKAIVAELIQGLYGQVVNAGLERGDYDEAQQQLLNLWRVAQESQSVLWNN